jgi:hypothetical protein
MSPWPGEGSCLIAWVHEFHFNIIMFFINYINKSNPLFIITGANNKVKHFWTSQFVFPNTKLNSKAYDSSSETCLAAITLSDKGIDW